MSADEVDPVTKMTAVQKQSAFDLWRIIRQNQKFHGLHFYQRLMTQYPEYQQLFTFFKERQMDHLIRDRDPRLIVQALRIMLAFDTIFMSLDTPDRIIEFCYKLGQRHLEYGLTPAHFRAAQNVLVNSLAHDLSDQMDETSRTAVEAVLDFAIPHIIHGLEDARAGKQ